MRKGEEFNIRAATVTAVTGGAAGGASSEAVSFQNAFTPHSTPGQDRAVDVGLNSGIAVPGGVVANESKDSFGSGEEGEVTTAESNADKEAKTNSDTVDSSSAADKIKEDFG